MRKHQFEQFPMIFLMSNVVVSYPFAVLPMYEDI